MPFLRQVLKTEYTDALDRIREMKASEVSAGEDAERSTKNVASLLSQVTSNTKDLDDLHDKMEGTMNKHLDVREELLRQKEAKIKGSVRFHFSES